jgi:intein/homing endonuclease
MSIRKYFVNENFFDKWSPKMAYVLGFWFADGYMRHEKSYRISFCSKDCDILILIRECLSSNHNIIYKKKDDSKNLIIFSKKLYLKLSDLGGIRCKSRKVLFPSVPDRFLSDFIRGYFDGDGSVFFVEYINTKNKKLRIELRSNFTSGSVHFLEELQSVLNKKLGLVRKKICGYNNGRSLKLGYGTYDTLNLLNFMYYKNYPIGMARKARFLYNPKVQKFARKYDYFSEKNKSNWKNSIRATFEIL